MYLDIEMVSRFILACIWGGLVGAEREYRGKPAGFRTLMMISFGACFFTIMSIVIGGQDNPDRIAANIVTGLGFLSAGVIMRADNHISGITTAATVWAVAAVGMGIGGGYYFASGCGAGLILLVLAVLPIMETQIDRLNQHRLLMIKVSDPDAIVHCESLLQQQKVKYYRYSKIKCAAYWEVKWKVNGSRHRMQALEETLFENALFDEIIWS